MANILNIEGGHGTPTADKDHNVTKQKAHLQSHTGEKGASIADELMTLAEKNHDSEGAFSGTKYAPNDTPTFKNKGDK